jgi:hypothetical protein
MAHLGPRPPGTTVALKVCRACAGHATTHAAVQTAQYRFVFLAIPNEFDLFLPSAGRVSALPLSAFDELSRQLSAEFIEC